METDRKKNSYVSEQRDFNVARDFMAAAAADATTEGMCGLTRIRLHVPVHKTNRNAMSDGKHKEMSPRGAAEANTFFFRIILSN